MRGIEINPKDRIVAPEPGSAPMLQWLRIANLVIDDTYQRDLKLGNWKAIRQIAKAFRWSRFSPVFVAPIEGGKYAVIDGQHRTHAAAMCGYTEVPCQIVQMTREEQAASFAAVNGLVTKVTGWNIFKAALVAREPWALACEAVCADAGCRLMTSNAGTDDKKPGDIFAIQLIRQAVAAGNGKSITLALSGLRRSEFGQDYEAYSNEVLKPLFLAVSDRPWLAKHGVDLSDFLDRFDIWSAIDRANDFVKVKRRQGHTGISRFDIAAASIGEALDKAFPERIGRAA